MKVNFFANGLVIAFDKQGKQMVEIQRQSWFGLYLEWLKAQGYDLNDIEFTLPSGRVDLHIETDDINWSTR